MAFSTYSHGANRDVYYVFKGTFGGSTAATVKWATRGVAHSSGLYQGIVLDVGAVRRALSETIGGPPERASCSLTLDNADGALGKWLIGTAAAVATSYLDDSFANLTGKLYAGIITPAGGYEETAITPTMRAVSCAFTETTVSISLSSRDDRVLGASVLQPTIGQLASAAFVNVSDPDNDTLALTLGATAGVFGANELADIQDVIDRGDAQARDIPFAYGRAVIPAIRLADAGEELTEHVVLFAKKGGGSPPTLVPPLMEPWEFYRGAYGLDLAGLDRANSYLWRAELRLTREDGTTFDVWVVGAVLKQVTEYYLAETPVETDNFETVRREWAWSVGSDDLFVIAPESNRLSSSGTGPQTPSQVIRAIIQDLSELGSIDSASFDRALRVAREGGVVGGVVFGNTPLWEPITHICEAIGFRIAIGADDAVRISTPAALDASDATAIVTADPTKHIRADDIFEGGYSEEIPISTDAAGAAASRVTLEWDSDQEAFWPAELLRRRLPGVSTSVLESESEARASASWIYPPRAMRAFRVIVQRRNAITRRITITAPLWVGTDNELGQIMLLSYPSARGVNTTSGYELRAVRLESIEMQPLEDFGTYRFEDLGPVAGRKTAVYDSNDNWVTVNPAGGTVSIELAPLSSTVKVAASSDIFTADMVTRKCSLHVPGAANAENRTLAQRIVTFDDAKNIRVEFGYNTTETIAPSAGGTQLEDCSWFIMETQTGKVGGNTTKLTDCVEDTGVFTDASQGFQYSGG